MKIIQSGSKFNVHGDDLIVLDRLPAKTFKVGFTMEEGFFLVKSADLIVSEEKIYGENESKVDKTLRAFAASNRSLGAMFTGKKGYGKSLSLQLLSFKAMQEFNLPIIICTSSIPGLSNFLQSIQQEVVVIFDEFEKIFSVDGGGESQERLLSLFDGLSTNKHLYVISANEMDRISSYLIDRPGRFHYHFQFAEPTPKEVYEYMVDKLNPEYRDSAKSVMDLSKRTKFNFDTLRALAFELNLGYKLSSAIKDLNISLNEKVSYDVNASFTDGTIILKKIGIRLSTVIEDISFISEEDPNIVFEALLDFSKAKYENDEFLLDPSDVKVKFSHTRNDDDQEEDFVAPVAPKAVSILIKRHATFAYKDEMEQTVAAY